MNATLASEEAVAVSPKKDKPVSARRASPPIPGASPAEEFLELASFRSRVPRITVEEYHRQPECNANGRHTELIRGIVFEKMSRSPQHDGLASLLQALLSERLPAGYVAREEGSLTLLDSEPEPDVSVVRGTLRDLVKGHPTTSVLAVEIAISTLAKDRALAALYAENGVEEYWIVLPQEMAVEVYRTPENGRYREMRLFTRDEVLECRSVPGVRVALGELFAGIDPAAGE